MEDSKIITECVNDICTDDNEKELKDFANEILIKMGFKQNSKSKYVLPLKARFIAFFDLIFHLPTYLKFKKQMKAGARGMGKSVFDAGDGIINLEENE